MDQLARLDSARLAVPEPEVQRLEVQPEPLVLVRSLAALVRRMSGNYPVHSRHDHTEDIYIPS